MANISVAGIGSGLDVTSLVTQLIAAERGAADKRLAATESKSQVKLSALGSYRSALASLRIAVDELKISGGVGGIGALTAKSSDPTLFTAAASSGAVAGTYNIEVVSLARANKVASAAYASSATSVGAGTVTLTVAGQSFTVTLTAGNDSVAALRDAINGASDNTGASATLVNDAGGVRLMITASQTGVANAVSVTSAAAPLLPILPPGPPFITWTANQTAQNAQVRVDGYDTFSAVNNVTGAVDGVTLNLIKAAPGTTATLTIGTDSKTGSDAVQKFITAYNEVIKSATSLTRYNASTHTASALTGDATVRDASRQLRSILGGSVAGFGSYEQLWQIGITTNTDGSLKLDSDKLNAALGSDFSSVQNLFSSSNGLAMRLDTTLDGYLDTGGRLDAATKVLQSRLDDVADQKEALDRRMSMVEQRYLKQFSTLDTLMSQLQTTSQFLTNQLAFLAPRNNN